VIHTAGGQIDIPAARPAAILDPRLRRCYRSGILYGITTVRLGNSGRLAVSWSDQDRQRGGQNHRPAMTRSPANSTPSLAITSNKYGAHHEQYIRRHLIAASALLLQAARQAWAARTTAASSPHRAGSADGHRGVGARSEHRRHQDADWRRRRRGGRGVAGSTVGSGRGSVVGARSVRCWVALGGAATEEAVTRQKGVEITVKLDSGGCSRSPRRPTRHSGWAIACACCRAAERPGLPLSHAGPCRSSFRNLNVTPD